MRLLKLIFELFKTESSNMELNSNDEERPQNAIVKSKSPCFLCLSDSRKYIKPELDLDLGSDLTANEGEPAIVVSNSFSLRHISRYLKLFNETGDSCNNGNPSKFHQANSNKLFAFAKDSTVPVCENCSKLSQEFTDLHRLLEETKLRLDWCLQRMHDVMAKTMDESGSLLQAEEPLGNKVDEAKNIMAALRIKLVDRMRTVTSLRLPRLVLSKAKIKIPPPPLKVNLNQEEEEMKPTRITIKVKTRLKTNKPNEQSSRPEFTNTNNCSYCRAQFLEKNSFSGAWMLRQHILHYHCQHFFPSEKLDSITVPQYKKIVAELLIKDFITGNGRCSLCHKRFPASGGPVNLARLKSHLVESHHEELKQKLMSIQKDPDLLAKLSKCNPKGMMCPCGVYLPDLDSQINHKKDHCNLTKTQKGKGKIIKTCASAKTSKVTKPPSEKKKRTNPSPEMSNNFIPAILNKEKVTCKLWNKTIKRKSQYWRYTNGCTGILHRPNASKNNGGDDPQEIKDKTKSSSHPPKETIACSSSSTQDNSYVKCSFCRAKFLINGNELLRRHIIKYHSDQYFPNHKLDFITDLQFQKILAELLFKDLIEGKTSCLYCRESYRTLSEVGDWEMRLCQIKLHFLKNHYGKLEEELANIQNDPDLKRKLATCDPSGRLCDSGCGVYLSNIHIQKIHDKLHCTFTGSSKQLIIRNPGENRVKASTTLTKEDNAKEEEQKRLKIPPVQRPETLPPSSVVTKKKIQIPVPSARADFNYKSNFAPISSNNKIVFCKLCTKTVKQPTMLWHSTYGCIRVQGLPRPPRASEKMTTPEDETRLSCHYCRIEFRTVNYYKRKVYFAKHLVRFHPEHFFPDLRDKTDLTKDEFQRVIHNILLPEFIAKTKSIKNCSLCRKSFNHYNSSIVRVDCHVKKHLMEHHKTTLADRLREIMKDPNLKEKLSRFHTVGHSCRCGMYLPTWGKYSESYHERFHCKGMSSKTSVSERDEFLIESDDDNDANNDNDNDILPESCVSNTQNINQCEILKQSQAIEPEISSSGISESSESKVLNFVNGDDQECLTLLALENVKTESDHFFEEEFIFSSSFDIKTDRDE